MKTKQDLKRQSVEEIQGIPICGSNFANPITDNSQFMREIHYRIGDRLYIENAD